MTISIFLCVMVGCVLLGALVAKTIGAILGVALSCVSLATTFGALSFLRELEPGAGRKYVLASIAAWTAAGALILKAFLMLKWPWLWA